MDQLGCRQRQEGPCGSEAGARGLQSLRPGTGVIDLSSPSPVRKKSKASLGASVPNPDAAELGLPHDAEECPDPTLEEELEKVMDAELDILAEELAGFHDCSLR